MHIVERARRLFDLRADPQRIALFSRRLARVYPKHEIHELPTTASLSATRWIEAYFASSFDTLDAISDGLPLDLMGSEFELRVWRALLKIPVGRLSSYGEIARSIGRNKDAARAVGMTVGRNPLSILIPCHRVVGVRGAITGYGGGLARKQWLLAHEGFECAGREGSRKAMVRSRTTASASHLKVS